MDILDLAGANLQNYPNDNAEHNTVGNGVGERHHNQGDKTADYIRNIPVEFHLEHRLHHQQADKYQRRCGGKAGNRQEDWREEECNNEHCRSCKCRQAGAAAFGNTCGGLYKAGNRGGTQAGARNSADCITQQGCANTRELAVFVEQVALVCNTNQGADRVKQIDKQEGKHHHDKFH
ncbi:Uncharacterised protein [uncultured Ruminococcus sp.]|nr:Uncharacterised protein [uncultured Ruminococcus sp.]